MERVNVRAKRLPHGGRRRAEQRDAARTDKSGQVRHARVVAQVGAAARQSTRELVEGRVLKPRHWFAECALNGNHRGFIGFPDNQAY